MLELVFGICSTLTIMVAVPLLFCSAELVVVKFDKILNLNGVKYFFSQSSPKMWLVPAGFIILVECTPKPFRASSSNPFA